MGVEGYTSFIDNLASDIVIFNNKYIQAVVTLLFFAILAQIFLFFVKRVVVKFALKTKTEADDLIIKKSHRPLFYVLLIIGVELALHPLGLAGPIKGWIDKSLLTLIIIILVYLVNAVTTILLGVLGKDWAKKTETTMDNDLLPLVHKTSSVVFYILGFLFIISVWGVDITGFLAGLGIAGIAIGFAVKDSLANIFGGVSLILDKTFKIGEKIMIESGEIGVIEDIGLRSTKLRTFDNELVVIPNGYLSNTKIKNYVKPTKHVRVNVNFGVEYGTKPEKVRKVVLDTIKKIDMVSDEPPPEAFFLEMADSGLNFVARFWIDDYSMQFRKRAEATEKIYNALNRAKIGIPFPTRTVYIRK